MELRGDGSQYSLTVKLSTELNTTLERLVLDTGLTRAEVTRQAIQLMADFTDHGEASCVAF